jgi:hypothetical protein
MRSVITAGPVRLASFALCATAAAAAGQGQNAPVVSLPTPSATLRGGFTQVTSVRELADGRILVVDGGDDRLAVADFKTGSLRTIGRQGGGVGEYRAIRNLHPLAADSTLLPDPRNGRWLLLLRDSIVGALAADAPVLRAVGPTPLGADARGAVVTTVPRLVAGAPRMDSLLILRGYRSGGHVDTIGLLAARRPTVLAEGRIDPTRAVPIVFNPFASGEQVALFADGWTAVARLAPYRVDWIDPRGARTTGMPLPTDQVRVDDAEKLDVLAREARQTGRPARDAAEVGEWPAMVPAFLQNALIAAPDGRLWVRRTPHRRQPNERYDVVTRSGVVALRLNAQPGERIVGFGRSAIYSVVADADGLEHLRRHPMP